MQPRSFRPGVALKALCLVQFVDVLGVTVTITALPAMLAGLGGSSSAAMFVVTGYAMFFGGLLMLTARLGDRYGHRRVLLAGLAGFGAASAVAATATSVAVLVTARCLQGAAAACSVPTALRLLLAVAGDGDGCRRALAGWSAAGAAAGASGFLAGGALTALAGWRAVFWINVPLAALLVLGVLLFAPRSPAAKAGRLDVLGAAVLTASVMAVVSGAALLEHAGERWTGLLVLAAGAALGAMLVAVERRAGQPLLPAAALRHPRLRAAACAALLNTATTSSAMTLATLYLQDVRGVSPAVAGLMLLPCSVCVVAGSAAAAPLLRRWPARAGIAAGLAAIAAGVAALLVTPAVPWLLPAGVGVTGIGLGVSSVAANALGTGVPPALLGAASGVLNTAAQLGTALGVSVLLLVAAVSDGSGLPLAGRPLAWACASAGALTAAIVLAATARGAGRTLVPGPPAPGSRPQERCASAGRGGGHD
jgi:MFS family permease